MLRISLYSAIKVMFTNVNKILPKSILFYFQEPGFSFQFPYRDVPVPKEVLTKKILNLDQPGNWARLLLPASTPKVVDWLHNAPHLTSVDIDVVVVLTWTSIPLPTKSTADFYVAQRRLKPTVDN